MNDSREQTIGATALAADEARARFLVALRRARGHTCGQLPVDIDLRRKDQVAAFARGGWSRAETVGAWTDGPMSELLIVPDEAPQGAVDVVFEIADVLFSVRHGAQSATIAVNGAAQARWAFRNGEAWARQRTIVVPADDVTRLGAVLVTLHVHTPQPLMELGVRHDTRTLGIALRSVCVSDARVP